MLFDICRIYQRYNKCARYAIFQAILLVIFPSFEWMKVSRHPFPVDLISAQWRANRRSLWFPQQQQKEKICTDKDPITINVRVKMTLRGNQFPANVEKSKLCELALSNDVYSRNDIYIVCTLAKPNKCAVEKQAKKIWHFSVLCAKGNGKEK